MNWLKENWVWLLIAGMTLVMLATLYLNPANAGCYPHCVWAD